MTPTPVGMRCPECSKQNDEGPDDPQRGATSRSSPTRSSRSTCWCSSARRGRCGVGHRRRGGSVIDDGALFGPAIAHTTSTGGWSRRGFLHAGLLHIAFNMYLLYMLGHDARAGASGACASSSCTSRRCSAARSARCLLSPESVTVGASGAVFGLMGAFVVIMRARGADVMGSGIPVLIGLNLLLVLRPRHLDRRPHRRADRRRHRRLRPRQRSGTGPARSPSRCWSASAWRARRWRLDRRRLRSGLEVRVRPLRIRV